MGQATTHRKGRSRGGEAVAKRQARGRSSVGSGLGKAERAATLHPLFALLEQFDTLVALQDAALGADVLRFLEAGVLGHRSRES